MAGKLRPPRLETLPRERLNLALAPLWQRRLALVVAPAGSGKTSLLAGFAESMGLPVAWYRAESWDGAEATLVRHLELGLTAALPDLSGGWETVEDAAAALDQWSGGPALLVIDDLHHLEGSPAEAALERLVEYAPPWLAVLAGSRVQPAFNLSRRRVSGALIEIGPDDLRFRSWEVERLFRDIYGARIPPQELATLARQTEGWAAGLQLFHLATRDKSAEERRQLLAVTGRSSRLTREYLASNVVGALDPGTRQFLVETCVMGRRLCPPLCDQLRGEDGSRAVLEDLERRGIFTVRLDDDDGAFRYHEVLRGYLDWLLVDMHGLDGYRGRYRRAGEILEEAGLAADALSAFCRAEDWGAVQRLLGRDGERLVGEQGPWLEHLPPALLRRDPWLILATARWARAEGRWAQAADAYLRAEVAFGRSAAAEVCRAERLVLAAWLQDAPPAAPRDWSGLLRVAVSRDPRAAIRETSRLNSPAERSLVTGIASLLDGQVREAAGELLAAAERPGLSPTLAAVARLAGGVAALLGGDSSGLETVEHAVREAEAAGSPWLTSLGRVAQGLGTASGGSWGEADLDEGEDPWGEALGLLVRGLIVGTAEGRLAAAEAAEARLRRLGAGTLEAWARGLAALAMAELGAPEARDAAMAAEATARSVSAPALRFFGFLGLGQMDGDRATEFRELARVIGEETGLLAPGSLRALARPIGATSSEESPRGTPPGGGSLREARGSGATHGSSPARPLEIRCFGAFSLVRDGRPVDLAAVKPRSRTLLRYLALHAGSAVHREVLIEALWPEADQTTAARSLQVGISTLRGLLEPDAGRGESQLLVRAGEGYRLTPPAGAFVDVAAFDAALETGRHRRAEGRLEDAAASFFRAVELHRGDLLEDVGPAEWVVEPRETRRAQAADAAVSLAELRLELGDPDGAARACRSGLSIDRYHDPLWRLLIEARDRAGDAGAALRARQEYETVLADLGLGGQGEVPDASASGDGTSVKSGGRRPGRKQAAPFA